MVGRFSNLGLEVEENKENIDLHVVGLSFGFFFRVCALSQVYVEYFYLPGCPDCEKTDPIIERIENEYGDVIFVDWVDVSTWDG